eukprot:TRINITY_DN3620_c0_g1_i6.p1 TRINITY_DN3620_c0_g1~~TRINITY_DN3620_c0_g1_i6.p1  ORF type:complete len:255 (+),score=24.31 TRINITY_DN3620_c0_g1_i6:162-926(+)
MLDLLNLRRHQRAAHGRVEGDGLHHHRHLRPSTTHQALRRAVRGDPSSTSQGAGCCSGVDQTTGDGNNDDDGGRNVGGPAAPDGPAADPTGMAAITREMRALVELSRVRLDDMKARDDTGGGADYGDASNEAPEYVCSTIATHVRVLYEDLKDVQRATPVASARRKTPRTWKVNSFRLQALPRYVLKAGGAGLSLTAQAKLFEFSTCGTARRRACPRTMVITSCCVRHGPTSEPFVTHWRTTSTRPSTRRDGRR